MTGNTDKALTSPAPRGAEFGIGSTRKFALLVPGFAFLVVAIVLALGLGRDPRIVPSPLIGKPVPEFDLPAVRGRTRGLASRDLRAQISLVNVFASWCVACREEHPLLMELARQGAIPVHGLNYKDRPEDAAAWLGAQRVGQRGAEQQRGAERSREEQRGTESQSGSPRVREDRGGVERNN